jgi:uncharacterized circularly permuted ATP-grasp superfamily protein
MLWNEYDTEGFYDEIFQSSGEPWPYASPLMQRIKEMPREDLLRKQRSAELSMMRMGITFNVYSDNAGVEKTFPFDLIPRIVGSNEWRKIEKGLKQRMHALNLFIDDLYNEQSILKSGLIPEDILKSSKGFREQCIAARLISANFEKPNDPNLVPLRFHQAA